MTVPAGRLAALTERRAALEARHPVWVPGTLHAALDDAAERWPDRPYVITDEAVYSYAEIRDRSLRLARALVAAGVRPGEHVALEMANYPEFVVGKFAISRTGAATIPVNFLNRRDELAYVLRQSRAVMLITMARFRDLDYIAMLDDIAPGWPAGGGGAALRGGGGAALPDLRQVVVFDNDGASVPAGASTLAGLEAGDLPLIELPVVELPVVELPAVEFPVVDPGATADILYTSGTTGGPKGVQLTHDMLLRTAYGAAYGRGFEDGRRIAFALPMYHVFGYLEGMLPAMLVGGAIIPHLTFDPVATLAAIERHRATDLLAIPLMTEGVMDAQQGIARQGLAQQAWPGRESRPTSPRWPRSCPPGPPRRPGTLTASMPSSAAMR